MCVFGVALSVRMTLQPYYLQEEWRRGLKGLRVDTINKLKKALPELEKEVEYTSCLHLLELANLMGS